MVSYLFTHTYPAIVSSRIKNKTKAETLREKKRLQQWPTGAASSLDARSLRAGTRYTPLKSTHQYSSKVSIS